MQNAPLHSAILVACIKLISVFKTFVLSTFEWLLNLLSKFTEDVCVAVVLTESPREEHFTQAGLKCGYNTKNVKVMA